MPSALVTSTVTLPAVTVAGVVAVRDSPLATLTSVAATPPKVRWLKRLREPDLRIMLDGRWRCFTPTEDRQLSPRLRSLPKLGQRQFKLRFNRLVELRISLVEIGLQVHQLGLFRFGQQRTEFFIHESDCFGISFNDRLSSKGPQQLSLALKSLLPWIAPSYNRFARLARTTDAVQGDPALARQPAASSRTVRRSTLPLGRWGRASTIRTSSGTA